MTERYWPRKTQPIMFLMGEDGPLRSDSPPHVLEKKVPVESLICVPQRDADRALDDMQGDLDFLREELRKATVMIEVMQALEGQIEGGSAWGFDLIPHGAVEVLRLALRDYGKEGKDSGKGKE